MLSGLFCYIAFFSQTFSFRIVREGRVGMGNDADLHIRLFAYWSDDRYRSLQGQIWTPLANAGKIQREGFKR